MQPATTPPKPQTCQYLSYRPVSGSKVRPVPMIVKMICSFGILEAKPVAAPENPEPRGWGGQLEGLMWWVHRTPSDSHETMAQPAWMWWKMIKIYPKYKYYVSSLYGWILEKRQARYFWKRSDFWLKISVSSCMLSFEGVCILNWQINTQYPMLRNK